MGVRPESFRAGWLVCHPAFSCMKTFTVKVFDHSRTSERKWEKSTVACNKYLKDAGVELKWSISQYPRMSPRFDAVPDGIRHHIDKEWFRDTYSVNATGHDFVLALFNRRDWKRPYQKNDLGGQSIEQNFGVSEIAMTGSHTFRAKRPLAPGVKESEFVVRFLHELCHGMFDHKVLKPDVTHEWHYDKGDLLAAFQLWGFKESASGLLPAVQKLADLFIALAATEGFNLRVTSGWRSFEEQEKLYAQGRTTPGKIVTNARAGESWHNWGCAFDVADRIRGYDIDWERVGKIGERCGFEWGGRWAGFIDRPHFQLTLGYTLEDFQNKKVDYSRFNI